jgi:hypothetical protein
MAILQIDPQSSPRVITVLAPDTEITIQELVNLCRDWEDDVEGMPYSSLISAAGKENLGGGVKVGITATLLNAVIAFEARSGPSYIQCRISGGNLVAIDEVGGDISPIFPTAFTQVLTTSSSSATLQDLESIQAATYVSGVAIDPTSSYTGSTFPVGTREFPVNNMHDLHDIAISRGLQKIYVMDHLTVSSIDLSGFRHAFIGDSPFINLTIDPDSNFQGSTIENLTIQGEVDGFNTISRSNINNITNVNGFIEKSGFNSTCKLNGQTAIMECYSLVEGMGYPTFDIGSNNLIIRDFHGSVGLTNITGGTHTIEIYGGRPIFDNTCTGGTVYIRGDLSSPIEDNSNGTTIISQISGKDHLKFTQYIGLK